MCIYTCSYTDHYTTLYYIVLHHISASDLDTSDNLSAWKFQVNYIIIITVKACSGQISGQAALIHLFPTYTVNYITYIYSIYTFSLY